MFKNALISVSDKTGLVEFIRPLAEQGLRIVSTGGTAQVLREAGFTVVDVSQQTGFPEIMDGRVKTLHPKIHMALLARLNHAEDVQVLGQHDVLPFDLVIGNLYPFEEAQKQGKKDQELIEYIDIGGPSFLRAAAKSFERIAVICDPSDYQWVLDKGQLDQADRQRLAAKVFAHTSSYDAMVAKSLGQPLTEKDQGLGGAFVGPLRYGENPQQEAAWYRWKGVRVGLHNAEVVQGKPLSFNNLLDLNAAVETLKEFPAMPTCVAVKHNNPCGVAMDKVLAEAVAKALKADPVSVFGGIVAVNQKVTESEAQALTSLFLECVVAPDFSVEALAVFAKKKNLRVLRWKDLMLSDSTPNIRSVQGGFLLQAQDQVSCQWDDTWEVIGQAPTEDIKQDLLFTWKICAHLKSNAIAIARHGQTLGLGMGQVNRVDAVAQAIERWQQFHASAKSPVLASDAFFPFADSIEKAAQSGIQWIIQPGGSVRDDEVKTRAKELKVNLVMTGRRHFLH